MLPEVLLSFLSQDDSYLPTIPVKYLKRKKKCSLQDCITEKSHLNLSAHSPTATSTYAVVVNTRSHEKATECFSGSCRKHLISSIQGFKMVSCEFWLWTADTNKIILNPVSTMTSAFTVFLMSYGNSREK